MAAASVADSPKSSWHVLGGEVMRGRGSAQALAYGDHLIRAQKRQKTKKLAGAGGRKRRQGHQQGPWARLPATNENDQLLSRHPTWACGTTVPLSAGRPGAGVTPPGSRAGAEVQRARCPAPSPLGTRASRTFRSELRCIPLRLPGGR